MNVNGTECGLDPEGSGYSSRQWNLEWCKNDEFDWWIMKVKKKGDYDLWVCYKCTQSGDGESDTYWVPKKETNNTEFQVHYIRTFTSHEFVYILTSPTTVVLRTDNVYK
jgi:hypothetical protein